MQLTVQVFAVVQHSASVHGSAAQLMPAGLGSRLFAWTEQSCGSSALASALVSAQVRGGGTTVQHSASVHGSAAQLMPAGLASSSFACEEQSCASSAVPSPLLSAQVRVQTPGPGTCGLQLRQVQLLVEV